jgi:hypothetical protein
MGEAHYTEVPPWERAAHYRKLARKTEALGEKGSAEFRQTCREFAARWRMLANELMTSGFEHCNEETGSLPGREYRPPAMPPAPREN